MILPLGVPLRPGDRTLTAHELAIGRLCARCGAPIPGLPPGHPRLCRYHAPGGQGARG